jgi:hypothetical protein
MVFHSSVRQSVRSLMPQLLSHSIASLVVDFLFVPLGTHVFCGQASNFQEGVIVAYQWKLINKKDELVYEIKTRGMPRTVAVQSQPDLLFPRMLTTIKRDIAWYYRLLS